MRRHAALWVFLAALAACDAPDAPRPDTAPAGDATADLAGDTTAACEALPWPSPALCLGDGTEHTNELYQGFTRSLSGPVVALGVGGDVPIDHCWFGGVRIGGPHDLPGYMRSWFRLRDGDTEWTVGLQLPDGTPFEVSTGDVLHVEVTAREEPFAPDVVDVRIHRGGDDLVLWLATAGDTADLTPPDGLALARGGERCRVASECGEWAAYDLDATRAGEAATVPYGEAAMIGPYRVRNAGARWQTSQTQCPDWFVAEVTVLATFAAPPCANGTCPAPLRCDGDTCRARPPACGGPPPDPECTPALENADCRAHGGEPLCPAFDSETCWCDCPTGDEGCPCWRASHCQGRCEGADGPGAACETLATGKCSDDTQKTEFGCHCIADPTENHATFGRLCEL